MVNTQEMSIFMLVLCRLILPEHALFATLIYYQLSYLVYELETQIIFYSYTTNNTGSGIQYNYANTN